jgi:hypothetical protein
MAHKIVEAGSRVRSMGGPPQAATGGRSEENTVGAGTLGHYGLKGRIGMRDMPTVDELLGDTTDPPPPVRAILCVVGSNEDDSEGRLELRPWPDASPEEKAVIARIKLCQSAWIGPRELSYVAN